jgi:hydroxyacylglutathione hydrolase
MKRGTVALSPRAFEAAAEEHEALILDTRGQDVFGKGFIPNSIFISIDGSFATWVGALIVDIKQPILIVAPKGREEEAVMRLARVGYDNAIGYLEGGFEAWQAEGREIDTLEAIDAKELEGAYTEDKAINILDVRKPSEWEAEHLESSQNFPLDYINSNMSEVDRNKKYYLHCRSGNRSTIAASILKARGFHNLVNVLANMMISPKQAFQERNMFVLRH